MTPQEQKEFVHDLLGNFEKKLAKNIDDGVVPPEWDGFELRELIFDMARESRAFSRLGIDGRHRRMRDYQNFILVSPELF